MWDSSSEDDWMKKPAPSLSAGRGESAMMAARRQALQRQREQQQQQQATKPSARSPSTSSGSRRAPTAGRLGSPTPLSGASSDEKDAAARSPPKPRPVDRQKPLDPAEVTENTIAELTRQVEAKRKLLASTRERERALMDKWRAAKAQKNAEIAQLDAQLRTLWSAVEDAKATADTRIRDTHDELEHALREARRDAETEARRELEPQIKEAEAQLEALRSEEARLRTLLSAQGDTRDLVSNAVSAAVTTILGRVQTVFAEGSDDAQRWNEDVKDLLRREVRSSFAVSAGSEAQAEREEYQRQFEEMLAFWKSAEAGQWDRVAKMDDALLADMERMAKEDVQRLQHEEQTMEELYAQSREAWTQEHQKTLYAELQSAIERRRQETESQRQARHRLHVERMQDLERRHAEQTSAEESFHKLQMEQLRDLLAREEQLQEDRHRAQLTAQEDIAKVTESTQGVVSLLEQILISLRDYQQEVDQSRTWLHKEHALSVQESVESLTSVVELLRQQTSSTDGEQRSLHNAATQLQVVSDQVEKQLETEATWLAEQETLYARSKEEWEREYRQWKHIVQREKHAAENRLSAAVTSLQENMALLDGEERNIRVETTSTNRAYADAVAASEKELGALKRREEELEKRHEEMRHTLRQLEEQSAVVAKEWTRMREARATVNAKRDALREDESKLQQMLEALRLVRAQVDGMRAQTVATGERSRALKHQLAFSKAALQHAASGSVVAVDPRALTGKPDGGYSDAHAAANFAAGSPATTRKNRHRLPLKILQELKQQLQTLPTRALAREEEPSQWGLGLDAATVTPSTAQIPSQTHATKPVPLTASSQARASAGEHYPARGASVTPVSQTPSQRSPHVDPYAPRPARTPSQPLTEHSSNSLLTGTECSPGNTFTNLVNFTDNDTTSQSFRTF